MRTFRTASVPRTELSYLTVHDPLSSIPTRMYFAIKSCYDGSNCIDCLEAAVLLSVHDDNILMYTSGGGRVRTNERQEKEKKGGPEEEHDGRKGEKGTRRAGSASKWRGEHPPPRVRIKEKKHRLIEHAHDGRQEKDPFFPDRGGGGGGGAYVGQQWSSGSRQKQRKEKVLFLQPPPGNTQRAQSTRISYIDGRSRER